MRVMISKIIKMTWKYEFKILFTPKARDLQNLIEIQINLNKNKEADLVAELQAMNQVDLKGVYKTRKIIILKINSLFI